MLFLLLGLLTGAIGAIPLFIAKKWKIGAIYGAVLAALAAGVYYLNLPSLVYPLWGAVGVVTGLALAAAAGIAALLLDSENDRGREPKRLWPVIILPALAVLLFAGRGCSGCGAVRANDYARMIGDVEQRVWTEDVQPKDPNHIRLVPLELAQWLADKQLGEAPGAIGSQFELDKGRMTLQMINGELWYVAPLDFRGFGVWNSTGAAPGYVMVSGEDPHRNAVLKIGETFAYTPGAYFGHNLERHLWTHGYATRGLTDYSFEIDDAGKPWWVVTVYEPSIAWSGRRVLGVVVVNPADGATAFHALGSVPEWIDRAVPASFVHDYIEWRGEYAGGWVNSWWDKLNITVPQTPTFVHGSDGQPYWVTDVTSSSENDRSLVGLMYTNARTGRSVYYRAVGSIDEAVLQAVNNKVAYRRWHGASPVLYNIYGTMASIVPLLGESHTFQGVAIVRIENVTEVAIGDDLSSALREYQRLLGAHGSDAVPAVAHTRRTLEGRVDRFAIEVRTGETTCFVHLEGVPRIFTGSGSLSPKLPLTRVGDEVTVTYIASPETVVPIMSFENRSLPLEAEQVPPATPAPRP